MRSPSRSAWPWGELPRRVDASSGAPEEVQPHPIQSVLVDDLTECLRFADRDGHPLCVEGVQCAHGVARHDIPTGESPEAVVRAAEVPREAAGRRLPDGLRPGHYFVDVTGPQRVCVVDEAVEVDRWAFSQEADEGHEPPIALDGEHQSAAAVTGWDAHRDVSAAVEVLGLPSEQAGGVVHPDVESLLVRRHVTELGHPAWGGGAAPRGG